jgi:uncharacterized protein YlzI (FlbEa/FlbD family)
MSKFIELTQAGGRKVLINIDHILDVSCDSGDAYITLGSQGTGEYYYKFPDYAEVVNKIMEVTE